MEERTLLFKDIFNKIVDDYNLTNADVSSIFGCSEYTVPSYKSGRTPISIDKAVALRSFLKESYNVDIYEKYIFEFDNEGFYFHGSRQGIKGEIVPDYVGAREKIDYGKGFYLGESFKQSSTFIAEEKEGKDRVYKFVFNTEGLKQKELKGLEWVFYVGYHRDKITNNKDNHKLIQQMKKIDNIGFDIISGPIADDKMSSNMEEFFADHLTYGQIIKCLTQLSIGNQYCLKTNKACKRLECVGIYIIDDALRYLIREYASGQRNEAADSATKIASSKDDGGLKFSELVKKYAK